MINCNRRDGSARPVNEVAERLARRGHDVHLFARKAEDLDFDLVKWHRVPGPDWPEVVDFASYHWTVGAKIRQHGFDIVHSIGCNAPEANVITIQNIQPAKARILQELGRDEKVSLPRRLTRSLYLRTTAAAEAKLYTHAPGRPAPLFLPVSHGVEKELRQFYDIGPAPVRIVPNAADTAIFRPRRAEERQAWRRENGFADSDTLLIFCGGEWARKGLDLALQALALLKRPDVKLFVAGDDPDRARFQTMADALGLAAQVRFGGFRRDTALAMASSDAFFFPSRYEAFSLATIEAAACGLPILASPINGAEDFVRPGETGEFLPPEPQAMATLLADLLADPGRLRRMGEAARVLVERDYTWDRVAELTESAYVNYLGDVAARPNAR